VKVIKPQRVGILSKPFEANGECFLGVGLLVFFPLRERALLSEVAMWKTVAEELGEQVLDECMPKSAAEFLVAGHAFAPGGRACEAMSVRVAMSGREKTLYVVGDRYWINDRPSAPVPFVQMPITWHNAFGGKDFARNPVGKGITRVNFRGHELQPLPNVEDPKRPVSSPRETFEPAGFGPFDFAWPQRFEKAGTYDLNWLKTGFPGFAQDLDWRIFNRAPADQWLGDFFRPDETFVVEGMHATRPRLEGKLPGVVGRCFANLATETGERFCEIATRLDTLWLFPHLERGVLVMHGMIKVQEDDAADVVHLVVGCEDPGAPKSVEHYRQVLRDRLDPEKGAVRALDDSPLLPAWAAAQPPDDELTAMQAALSSENLMEANLRRKAEREIEKARALVAGYGLDPDEHGPKPLPPMEPPPNLEAALAMAEKAEADAEAQKREAERATAEREPALRALCAEHGIDFDELKKEWTQPPPGGPPTFSAAAEIAKLEKLAAECRALGTPVDELDQMAADPELRGRLEHAEAQLKETYRIAAHLQSPAREPDTAAKQATRARVLASRALAGADLTGAELSRLDLRGYDFRGAFLEGANLSAADLREADFTRAVLARADLREARLDGAKLDQANLGAARFERAAGEGVSFGEAILGKAVLTGARFRNCGFAKADFMEAVLAGADLSGAATEQLILMKIDLSGTKLAGARLANASFLECKLDGADFGGSRLEAATFLSAMGGRTSFAGAILDGARFVKECSFEAPDFRAASLAGANLRGSRLTGAIFDGARMDGADLSECSLEHARFHRARAREARFVKAALVDAMLAGADLLGAILQKADLRGADLRGANLFGADVARIRGDSRTHLTDANQKRARIHPVRRP